MDTLTTLCRRERIIATVRWVAVVFALVQVSAYQAPAPSLEHAAAAARPGAYALVAALATVGVLAELALRGIRTARALVRAGMVFLVADVAIAVGFLYVFAFDPISAQWALLVVLPLEGALRLNLAGALGVWAAVTPLYVLRDLYLTARPFEPAAVNYRMGLLLVVALFAGTITRELDEQRRTLQGLSEASRQLVGRVDPAEILRALCRESVRALGAASAVAYVHDGAWFQSVASWPPDELPNVVDADLAEDEDPQLAHLVTSAPTWLEADDRRPARLAVPLRVADAPAHVVVLRPRSRHGFSPFTVDAAAALAEAAGLALMTSRMIASEQRTSRRLRYLEALRTRFVATIAHDLRLPLTVFKGVSTLLRSHRQSLDPAQMDEMLSSVERQANRLSRLADDLLDAARMDADKLTLQLEPCDVAEVVTAAVSDLNEEVDVDVPAGLDVLADRARLERILWNLLSNAEKYGKPPFEVRARSVDDTVEISVRDHGSGLDPVQRARLFQDFAGSDDAASVGLGLAIVYQLVQAHGGTVAYSDADPGARFVVRLPVNGPEAEGAAPVSRSTPSHAP